MPSKVLTVLQGDIRREHTGILAFKEMFVSGMFYNRAFSIPNEAEVYRRHEDCLKASSLSIRRHNSNIDTLRVLSRMIYSSDLEKNKEMKGKLRESIQSVLDSL
jgi:hypothetical protein